MKKITSLPIWTMIKAVIKYSAYLVIVLEGLKNIISQIEVQDGSQKQNENNA